MYYYTTWEQSFVIKNFENKDFIFGPFESESDTHFLTEMFNMNRLKLNQSEGDRLGKENIEDTNTVY